MTTKDQVIASVNPNGRIVYVPHVKWESSLEGVVDLKPTGFDCVIIGVNQGETVVKATIRTFINNCQVDIVRKFLVCVMDYPSDDYADAVQLSIGEVTPKSDENSPW